jgi:two-component system, chemotaxis family, response regulator Rcp1
VLLVEDNTHYVRLMKEAISEINPAIALHVANDGIEAMEFLRREGANAKAPRPDLILLDLNLPRMDGRKVLKHIKTDENLRTIPTLILTTSEMDDDVTKSYHGHVNAYLKRPLEWDAFVIMVASLNDFWLSRSQLPPPNQCTDDQHSQGPKMAEGSSSHDPKR